VADAGASHSTRSACVVAATAAVAAAGTTRPAIRQSSIAKARLGLSAGSYQTLFGNSGTPQTLSEPDGWSELYFADKKVGVYFADGPTGTGTVITTWNRRFKTGKGVGPCSTVKRLKRVYGHALKPSKFNTIHGVVYAWTIGKNLIFATNGDARVHVVGLYDGSAQYPAAGRNPAVRRLHHPQRAELFQLEGLAAQAASACGSPLDDRPDPCARATSQQVRMWVSNALDPADCR
jgi:hypothetical protein